MKVAVIGSGTAGRRHLRIAGSLSGVEVIAVPTRPSRVAELEAAGYMAAPDIHSAANWGAKAAIVATDTGRHFENSISALAEGLDLLIEKPMAVDSVEAIPVRDRAAELDRLIFVGCVLRFSESLGTYRRLLEKVGRIHSVCVDARSYLPDWRPERLYRDSYSAREKEGGVLRDLIHEIDYAGWLFGWPTSTQGKLRNLGRLDIASDEVAELTWETSSGCSVSLNLDYLSKPPRRRMTAYGEGGTIEWDGIAQTVTLSEDAKPVQEIRSEQTLDEMFLAQARAFIDSVGGVEDPLLATGDDGVRALEVCDAARKASDTRQEEVVVYQ